MSVTTTKNLVKTLIASITLPCVYSFCKTFMIINMTFILVLYCYKVVHGQNIWVYVWNLAIIKGINLVSWKWFIPLRCISVLRGFFYLFILSVLNTLGLPFSWRDMSWFHLVPVPETSSTMCIFPLENVYHTLTPNIHLNWPKSQNVSLFRLFQNRNYIWSEAPLVGWRPFILRAP